LSNIISLFFHGAGDQKIRQENKAIYKVREKTKEATEAFNKAIKLNPNMKTIISQLTKRI